MFFDYILVNDSTSECEQFKETRYIGLRPKKLHPLKQASYSESSVNSEYDSESSYLPSNLSDENCCLSDIDLDLLIDTNESKITQPYTSPTMNKIKQQGILNNEAIESYKILKPGYNLNGLVET